MTHPRFERRFGRLRERLQRFRIPAKISFIVMGILATGWFLVRVIPKPTRAGYPCMRAAFPIMTTFMLWLASFTGAFGAFKAMGRLFRRSRYLAAAAVFIAGLAFSAILINTGTLDISAKKKGISADPVHVANQPMGDPKGIFPGRVVWAWDPDATDENCVNTKDDPYYDPANNDQAVIDELFANSLLTLTGKSDPADAWEAIFKHFNDSKGKGSVGYSSGETVFIKINEGTSDWISNDDLTRNYSGWAANRDPMSETTPAMTLALVRQLVDEAGIPQENIWVADPKAHVWQHTYELVSNFYPDVKFGDKDGNEHLGRTALTEASSPSTFYAENGTILDEDSETYFEELINADYLVNLAALKAHARAGITLTAKNHFGSHIRGSAAHLHPGLVAPENDQVERADYGMYRTQVDIMGSNILGRNTLLYIVDGLWSGTEATEYPEKWVMQPFDGDFPNSLFMSLDQVALESVCFDFLRHEAEVGASTWKNRPNFAQGVDDYLHQAADQANWPDGITYDPDNTGTPIPSLGVHEHWNNPDKKQYIHNMGRDGGIELVSVPGYLVEEGFEALEVTSVPTVDGAGTDECWENAVWYEIDQLWIPWGVNDIAGNDFSGRFKVMWSSDTDELYFLVETTDDVFVDGYEYPNDGYPNFDIVEVFIDEDMSGGLHVFDGTGSVAEDWGTNAENAFSYHIAVDQPSDGGVTNTAHVLDIAGTSWGDKQIPDYFSHFPELVVSRDGNNYTWEFSMKVHSDAYDPGNASASLVELEEGKQMGLSVAYCDNDTPGTDRDNFFGSVAVTEEAYNDHWKLADDYGKLKLLGSGGASINTAPYAVGTVDDYVVQSPGGTDVVVSDLDGLFDDAEGDILTYSFYSDDEKLTASQDGNTVVVETESDFTGPATVTIMVSDGEFTEEITFTVTAFVGITLEEMEESARIYPNPASGEFVEVDFTSPANGEVFIRVIGLNGQMHNVFYFEKGQSRFRKRIPVNTLQSGVYILEIHNGGAVINRKLVR